MRYLSLHSNQYQRYFHGHSDEVTSVNLSPRSDTFLSAAKVALIMPPGILSEMCSALDCL